MTLIIAKEATILKKKISSATMKIQVIIKKMLKATKIHFMIEMTKLKIKIIQL